MSRNGSGTYTLPAGNPVVSGTSISSTWANNTLSDIATALTASIAKDGQTTPTANLPIGGFKLTGLGAGTTAGDSLRYEQLFGGNLGAIVGVTSINSGQLAGLRNRIINGDMKVAQRATTYALTNAFAYGSVDRWGVLQDTAASGIANQDSSSTPAGFQFCMKLGRNNGSTSTNTIRTYTALETRDSIPLQSAAVTLSFYAKSGANFSGTNLQIRLAEGQGSDQAANLLPGGSWTSYSEKISTSQVTTTTWTRYQFTGTFSASVSQIGVGFFYTPVGTAGADDNIYITGVQLEIGSVATTFEQRPIELETALCQRYYYRRYAQVAGDHIAFGGYGVSATQAFAMTTFPVQMRTRPTALEQSGTATDYVVERCGAGTFTSCSAVPAYNDSGIMSANTTFTVAAGLTNGTAGSIYGNNTNAYLGWSAEL